MDGTPPIMNPEPPSNSIPLDMQDVIEDLKQQLMEANYQNTLLRLTLKNAMSQR